MLIYRAAPLKDVITYGEAIRQILKSLVTYLTKVKNDSKH